MAAGHSERSEESLFDLTAGFLDISKCAVFSLEKIRHNETTFSRLPSSTYYPTRTRASTRGILRLPSRK
jgi:hypothetical protein